VCTVTYRASIDAVGGILHGNTMAAIQILPTTRSQLDAFLRGDELSAKFHELYQSNEDAAASK
jgi:hypothetical protein